MVPALPVLRLGGRLRVPVILLEQPGRADQQLALAAGLKSCVLETSSHALAQHRVSDVDYDAAIFTHLSQEVK